MSRRGKRKAEEEEEETAMNGAGQTSRSSAEIESLIDSFVAVTSATRDVARSYLAIYEWQLESAMNEFFLAQESDPVPEPITGNKEEEEEDEGEENDSDDEDYFPLENENDDREVVGRSPVASSGRNLRVVDSVSRSREKAKAKKPIKGSGIRTFSDLKGNAESDSNSDTDSDEDQDFYAGGKKRDSSRKRSRNTAEDVFEQARKFARPGPSKSKSKSFTGRGRVLSSEETPSSGAQQRESASNIVHFFTNGFIVNDGPLRRFDDPENADFLESIKRSECPEELKPSDGSLEVPIKLIHKQTHFFTPGARNPNKRSMQNGAFRGNGRTLGTDPEEVPDTTAEVSLPSPAPESNTIPTFQVDESLPTTSLQIRLSDGTRLVARFNTSHTIRDLRAFIDASRPSGTITARSYQLQTVGFPPKPLDDISKTIEEEGIANSVVIQKV